ncbi:hypothetical protein N2152v2_005594 [Parachlorella kessleri]
MAKVSLDLSALVVAGGAGDWALPAALVQALNAWVQAAFALDIAAAAEEHVAALAAKDGFLTVSMLKESLLQLRDAEEDFKSYLLKMLEENQELVSYLLPTMHLAALFLIRAWRHATTPDTAASNNLNGCGSDSDDNSSCRGPTAMPCVALLAENVRRLCSLLLAIQKRLVAVESPAAEQLQQAAYQGVAAVRITLARALEAMSCENKAAEATSAGNDTTPLPATESVQGVVWRVAVACYGAFDHLAGVLAAEKSCQDPMPGKLEPASVARVDMKHMRATLVALVWRLEISGSPLVARVAAAALRTAESDQGHGARSVAAMKKAALTAKLALQTALLIHLTALHSNVSDPPPAWEPGAQWDLLLRLLRAQGQDIVRLVLRSSTDELREGRELLLQHMSLLVGVLQLDNVLVDLEEEGDRAGDKMDSQGAIYQVLASLQALLSGFVRLERALPRMGSTANEHQSSVVEAAKLLLNTILVVDSALLAESPEVFLRAGSGWALAEALTQVFAHIKRCPKPAAWQLAALEQPLDLLLKMSRRPSALHLSLCSGGYLGQLAEWVVLALRGLLEGMETCSEDPQYGPALHQFEKRAYQMFRNCWEVTDKQTGTQLAGLEGEITACSGRLLRLLLSEGKSLHVATLQAALHAWEQRLQLLLGVAGQQSALAAWKAEDRGSSSSSSSVEACSVNSSGGQAMPLSGRLAGLPAVALHRELKCSRLGCANPLCMGEAASFSMKRRLDICAGCRTVQYCSEACAKGDWMRHRPSCAMLKQMIGGDRAKS